MATKKTKIKKISSSPALKTSIANRSFLIKLFLAVSLGGSVFFLAKNYRHLVLVGTINTTPISRWQLTSLLIDRYGQATLDELINEILLKDLAQKESISINPEDVATEKKNLVERLGGEEQLDATLKQYGLTPEELDKRLEISLVQKQLSEKLFTVQITDEDIKVYFDSNQYLYPDKKLEDVQDEIKDALTTQKFQEEFTAWFEKKRQEAKINRYI